MTTIRDRRTLAIVASGETFEDAATAAGYETFDDERGIYDWYAVKQDIADKGQEVIVERDDGARPVVLGTLHRPWNAWQSRDDGVPGLQTSINGRIFRGRVVATESIHGQACDRAPGMGHDRYYRYWVVADWDAIDHALLDY